MGDILIVGAGMSGLTAAAYLTKEGHRVTILERNSFVGGLLNSFTRDGYVFDTGARSIENSGIIRPMLRELGIELELLKSPVSIGIETNIINMDSKESIKEYGKLLESLYPGNAADVRKIFRIIKKVFGSMQVIYGFENPVFKDFRNDKKYLFKELMPWLAKFLPAIARMERMHKPVESFLAKRTSNQSIVDIIAQHFFKQTPTFFALGYFYVYLDYLYPRGGTGRLPVKLAYYIQEHGGSILLDTTVTSVDPAKKTIQDNTGQSYSYDKLLWCADLKTLYRSVGTSALEATTVGSISETSKHLFASRGGDSVFSLFLGIAQPPRKFAKITNGHLFYTPNRQGLGETHLSDLNRLLAKGLAAEKEEVLSWVETYSALTTYEVSIPSLRDPQLSPEGKTGLVVSFLLEYDLVRLAYDAGWYDAFKQHVEQCMIKTLNKTIFFGLLDDIELQFSSTPVSIERQFGSSEGGITGWTFERPSPVVNKLPKIPSSVRTAIPNVYQCGQWAYSPAGLPTAILTGWYAADEIRAKESR